MTKPTKWHVRPAKTQINLGRRPVWSESLLSAWRKLGSLATQWAYSEDSDQTGLPHDKTIVIKMTVHPAKTQISLGIHPVWSECLLSAWRKLGSLATHWVHSEDPDQTGQMPRLICVFPGCTVILMILSWGGSVMLLLYCSSSIMYELQWGASSQGP